MNTSSGIMAPPDIANDLLQAYQIGSTHAEKFVHECLCSGSVGFFDKLQKLKLKTFSSMTKTVTVRANSRDVAIKADRSFFSRMLAILTSRNLDLRMVLSFSLSPLPLSLASPQGNLNKTTKSSLLPLLESYGSPVEKNGRAAPLVDAMATIQSLTRPTGTFQDLAFQILRSVLDTRNHDQLSRVDFVIDRYPSISIKDAERSKHASTGVIVSHIINAYQRCPKQWKKYLSSGNNKSALLDFLVNNWTSSCYSRMLKNINFYVCSGTGCVRLTSTDDEQVSRSEVLELTCSHEEADIRLFLHAAHAAQSRQSTTIIKSPDTDVAVIGIYAASLDVFCHVQLLWLMGTKDRWRFMHLSRLAHVLGTEICNSLPGYHAFTGCDTMSAFYGKGKKQSFEILIKDRTIQAGMAGLGVAPECSLRHSKKLRIVCLSIVWTTELHIY